MKEMITEADLIDMDVKTLDFHKLFMHMIAPLMPRNGNTIKLHRLSHVTSVIRRLGALYHYDSNFYEGMNKTEKSLYRSTSKKTSNYKYLQEMVQRQCILATVSGKSTFNADAAVEQRQTTYMTAYNSGEHALAATRTVKLFLLSSEGHIVLSSMSEAGGRLLMAQPELEFLGSCMSLEFPELITPIKVDVAKTAVLAASVPWMTDEEAMLQTVRACYDFHGKPWFDCVKFNGPRGGQEEYGQLRLLFRVHVGGEKKDCAFVRLFTMLARTLANEDVLTRHGCLRLRWAENEESSHVFCVIPLSSIISKEYIVPDFRVGGNYFHVSPFKWGHQ